MTRVQTGEFLAVARESMAIAALRNANSTRRTRDIRAFDRGEVWVDFRPIFHEGNPSPRPLVDADANFWGLNWQKYTNSANHNIPQVRPRVESRQPAFVLGRIATLFYLRLVFITHWVIHRPLLSGSQSQSICDSYRPGDDLIHPRESSPMLAL